MSPDYFYGTTRKRATKQAAKPRPNKMRDNREVYFHRADVQEGTSFNDLEVGETVKFELLDDAVSGARALRVRRNKSK
jgi:cold shock CspA family protein